MRRYNRDQQSGGNQGDPTISKLAKRWFDVIELVQFARGVSKPLVTA